MLIFLLIKTVFLFWGAFETLSKDLTSLLEIGYFLTTEIFRDLFSLHDQWIAVWIFHIVFGGIIILIFWIQRRLVNMTRKMRVFSIGVIFLKIRWITHTVFPSHFSTQILLYFPWFENEGRADAVVSIERCFTNGWISLGMEDKIVALRCWVFVVGLIESLGVIGDVLWHWRGWISFFFFIEYFLI